MAHALAQTDHDSILSVMLEKGELAEVAKRANMTLAALATWANKHTDLLSNLHQLLLTRAKLLAAHLELSALNALATISSTATTTDDAKLRERALERQRKAANALLRHRQCLERTPRASVGPRVPTSSTSPNAEWRMPNASSLPNASSALNASSSLDASMPLAPMPSSSRTKKPSIAERLAARRLATMTAGMTAT